MPRRAPQVDVDVMVKERPMRTADLECEWQVAPGDKGRPALVSLVPGGSLTFEHRNIAKQARQARAPPQPRAVWPRRAAAPRPRRAATARAWPARDLRFTRVWSLPACCDMRLFCQRALSAEERGAVETCRAHCRARRSAGPRDSSCWQNLGLGREPCARPLCRRRRACDGAPRTWLRALRPSAAQATASVTAHQICD